MRPKNVLLAVENLWNAAGYAEDATARSKAGSAIGRTCKVADKSVVPDGF